MKFVLPDVEANIKNTEGDVLTLVLGGRAPSPEWFLSLSSGGELWAVDRGVEVCRRSERLPDRLVGDCDSASPESWQWAVDSGVPVSRYESEKDQTDFQLALDLACRPDNPRNIFVTGAFGGRFDHLWSAAVSLLHRSDEYSPLGMADDREGILFLNGHETLDLQFAKRPDVVSLIPFSRECWGVSISNVRWPLGDVVLEYRDPYSISNRLSDDLSASVNISAGLVGVYWAWDSHCL